MHGIRCLDPSFSSLTHPGLQNISLQYKYLQIEQTLNCLFRYTPVRNLRSSKDTTTGNLRSNHLRYSSWISTLSTLLTSSPMRRTQSISQKCPHSPLVPSLTATCISTPYLVQYSLLINSICGRSQWYLTSLEIRSSVRMLSDFESESAWWMSSASRTGLFITPLRMCANNSPFTTYVLASNSEYIRRERQVLGNLQPGSHSSLTSPARNWHGSSAHKLSAPP